MRTASGVYDPSNLDDRSIHLVNDAIQIQYESYGAFEDANKLSFDDFQAKLDAQPLPDGRKLSVINDLMPAMRSAVAHTFSCGLSQHFVPPPAGAGMFELFGFDFMVDTQVHAIPPLSIEASYPLPRRSTFAFSPSKPLLFHPLAGPRASD